MSALGMSLLLAFGAAGEHLSRAARPHGLWLSDPRSATLLILAVVAIGGIARRWWQGVMARRAIAALADPNVAPDSIRKVADHGREGVIELFRLLESAPAVEQRRAAGAALAYLWSHDELIVEEEKAVVTRGFEVTWLARRRYPRAMQAPIAVEVRFGVPFLSEDGAGVQPSNLEWSYRIAGTQRAALEVDSPWTAGDGCVRCTLEPGDFATLGPHRLVLKTKVRPRGLTDMWELALPHVPFTFEFDPRLTVDAIQALPDATRAEMFLKAVALEGAPEADPPRFLDLNGELALREPPQVVVRGPIPSDLAHRVELEFENIPGRFCAGSIVLCPTASEETSEPHRFALGPVSTPIDGIDRPGEYRLRVHLAADPHAGWASPDVRSLWPGSITTNWCPVRVVRK